MTTSPHAGRNRRTFPTHYKETVVHAYDLALQVSPSAADALLRAEKIPLSYVNRWRQDMGAAPSGCNSCHGSVHFPRSGTHRNKKNRPS